MFLCLFLFFWLLCRIFFFILVLNSDFKISIAYYIYTILCLMLCILSMKIIFEITITLLKTCYSSKVWVWTISLFFGCLRCITMHKWKSRSVLKSWHNVTMEPESTEQSRVTVSINMNSVCCSDETKKMSKTDKRTSSNEPKPVRASMPPTETQHTIHSML